VPPSAKANEWLPEIFALGEGEDGGRLIEGGRLFNFFPNGGLT